MLSCPRCVRPVAQQEMVCPHCGYDLVAAERSAPHAAWDHAAQMRPWAPQAHPGGFAPATPPSDQPGRIAPRADESGGLIPGLAEGPPPQPAGPPEEARRLWWGVGGAIVAALAVITVIAVLAAHRIGHRDTANAPPPVTTAAVTPPPGTSSAGTSPSGAVTSSASPTGSTSAADPRRGRAQASAIAGYLTQSGQARQGISAAISAISGCADIGSAVTTLRNAAEVRTRIVTSLATADVSELRGGAAAVADLARAMRASADADLHYAAWGQAVAGCHGHAPQNADFTAAQHSDTVATAAKQRFADEWNPIAARYGLAHQTANTI